MDERERREQIERREQVVGGILPDQADSDGNFAQTDNAGGPGDRPIIRRERNSIDPGATGGAPPDQTAGGGYGEGSGYGSSGGSQGGGENLSTGSATEFMRGEAANDLRRNPMEPRNADEPAADASLPPDVEGE